METNTNSNIIEELKIYKLNNNIEYIVANDISWSKIELIPTKKKVYFSVHNAIKN